MRLVRASLLLAVVALLGLPANAAAVQQWAAEAETCGGYNGTERGSGQIDARGFLYVPCSQSRGADGALRHDNYVAIMDAAGRQVGMVPLDFTANDGVGATSRASDVAPSPDGSYLYVIHYTEFTVYRFVRQADGSYRAQTQVEWSLGAFPWHGGGGANLARGQFLVADGTGDLYLSAGLWTCPGVHCTDNAIVKYRPTGAYVTRFGRKLGGSWALGDSHGNFGGVAVTADGRRVFATDINNSRVQRFDRADDGTYGAVLAMGMNAQSDPNRWGACYADGVLAGNYDVALSPRGELLVINTTCFATADFHNYKPYGTIEVQRFGQDGSVRGSIQSTSAGNSRVHGIAVDRSGNVHLLQAKVLLRPAAGWSDADADAGGGGPMGGAATVDTIAPTLTAVTAPTTTTARSVTVTIAAGDNVAVTEMRLRVDGALQAWRPYATSFEHVLADRLGDHALAVQVRDAAGNASGELATTIRRNATPVVVTPAPTPTPTQPVPTPIVDGGGDPTPAPSGDTTRPTITSVQMPVQVMSGRSVRVTVRARDDRGTTKVRFSVGNGRWGAWRTATGAQTVMLTTGAGWKGVLLQVRDAAGNRSKAWFQPVFLAPRGASWYKGTTGTDRARLGRGTQHADLSNFDKKVDRITCGAGYDTVLAQPEDIVARDCERVTRFVMPAW